MIKCLDVYEEDFKIRLKESIRLTKEYCKKQDELKKEEIEKNLQNH